MVSSSDTTKFQTGSFGIDYRSEPDGVKLLSAQTEVGDFTSMPTAMFNLAEVGLSGVIVAT